MRLKTTGSIVAGALVVGAVAAVLFQRANRKADEAVDSEDELALADGEGSGSARGNRGANKERLKPPSFRTDGTESKLTTDPMSPDYDPVALHASGVRLGKLFEREPRDPQWAPAMEERTAAIIKKDLEELLPANKLSSSKIECRRMICKVEFEAEDKETLTQVNRYLGAMRLGTGRSPSGITQKTVDGRSFYTFSSLLSFEQKNRNLADHERWYGETRKEFLDRSRAAGGHPKLPKLPTN